MIRKTLSTIFCGLLLAAAWAQGDLKGEVKDDKGEPVSFAIIKVMNRGTQITGTSADVDGKYLIKDIPPGKYDVIFSQLGMAEQPITGVQINSGQIVFLNCTLRRNSVELGPVVIPYTPPQLPVGTPPMITTIDREIIDRMTTTDIMQMPTLSPNVYSRDGSVDNINGMRTPVTIFVDGVKLRGLNSLVSLNRTAVQDATLLVGGTAAKYGDATGGIYEINTRTITPFHFGGVELRTSKFLDNWGHYYVAANFGGPLFRKKPDSVSLKLKSRREPIVGFFITAEAGYDENPRPTAGGSWKIKDDVLQQLIQSPLQLAPAGQSGTRSSAEYLHLSDFEQISARQNAAAMYINTNAKLDIRVSPSTFVTVGGFVNLRHARIDDYRNTLFNWENNGVSTQVNWNIWGKVTQLIGKRDTVKRLIRDMRLTLQTDYLKGFAKSEDALHGNNFFHYGYVGKFTTYRMPTYAYGYDPREDKYGWLYSGMKDTLVEFTPSELNPMSSTITSQYYTFFDQTAGNYDNFTSLQNRGALINGQQPDSPYDLWTNIGSRYANYAISDNSQFRAVLNFAAVIKDHDLQAGFEFEQRDDRAYTLQPVQLWTLARQYTNFHLGVRDTSDPHAVYNSQGVYQDTINYHALYVPDPSRPGFGASQTFFDYNLRRQMGLAPNSLNYIDVDALDPSQLQLNMFSADELLNQGKNLVTYYGYDVYGNRSDNSDFEDFFTATDEYGNKTRPISPFRPIYMAGYIMDKFSFKDILFNVGVRVDYFDANQKMLKDKYSLYQTQKVQDVTNFYHPANAEGDWVVYVNDKNNPTAITGYRDGDKWYNADGQEINDPTALRTSSGRVQPLLTDPTANISGNPGNGLFNAFTDYAPQVIVMPRISFTFPVSPTTQFVAYYDILTQRPSNAVRLNPLDYFFWEETAYNSGGTYFNNPALRPERTTDFSIGFRQALTSSSTIKINAYYREMRDHIALVKVVEAYPRSYGTWQNLDFGTVKGISLEYKLQKPNLLLTAGYALQFADNTGSSNVSALNLVNSGQPNLRTTVPTNFDRRHLITVFSSFDFGTDNYYLGPRGRVGEAIFRGLGISATLRGGSGVPYSRQSNIVPTQLGGGQPSLQGSINGARLPWEFSVDMMIYKNINLVFRKKEGKNQDTKTATLQLYLQIQNLLDIRNTINVYAATTSPTDDGYLTSPQFQPFINGQVDPQSFRDLYTLSMNNPQNYSMPRRVKFGVQLNF